MGQSTLVGVGGTKKGIKVKPEIMIPLVGFLQELKLQIDIVKHVAMKHLAYSLYLTTISPEGSSRRSTCMPKCNHVAVSTSKVTTKTKGPTLSIDRTPSRLLSIIRN